ncbi:unnamed protein product [Miscanthus lutarioriparius]|uniref:Uncharacterized protein n=1 Tax=Miscanthus lutarioriparius TaxID=422564 RepID=A0A811SD28_9POAL|nr:unnamed protein product [Miscanthus lutarioriparius]
MSLMNETPVGRPSLVRMSQILINKMEPAAFSAEQIRIRPLDYQLQNLSIVRNCPLSHSGISDYTNVGEIHIETGSISSYSDARKQSDPSQLNWKILKKAELVKYVTLKRRAELAAGGAECAAKVVAKEAGVVGVRTSSRTKVGRRSRLDRSQKKSPCKEVGPSPAVRLWAAGPAACAASGAAQRGEQWKREAGDGSGGGWGTRAGGDGACGGVPLERCPPMELFTTWLQIPVVNRLIAVRLTGSADADQVARRPARAGWSVAGWLSRR